MPYGFKDDRGKVNIITEIEFQKVLKEILPVATESTLGVVKVDNDTIKIDSDGTLRVGFGSH